MKIEVNISKKHFLLFMVVALFLTAAIVYAYNSSPADPAVFGHSASEIDGVCRSDGTGCPLGISNNFMTISSTTDNFGRLYIDTNTSNSIKTVSFNKSNFAGLNYDSNSVSKLYINVYAALLWDSSGNLSLQYEYPDGTWRTIYSSRRVSWGADADDIKETMLSVPVSNAQDMIRFKVLISDTAASGSYACGKDSDGVDFCLNKIKAKIIGAG